MEEWRPLRKEEMCPLKNNGLGRSVLKLNCVMNCVTLSKLDFVLCLGFLIIN